MVPETAPTVVKEILEMQHASKCQLFMVVLDLHKEVMWAASTFGCLQALGISQYAAPLYLRIRDAISPGLVWGPGLGEVQRSCSTCPTELVSHSGATSFGIRWKRVQQSVQMLSTEHWRVALLAQQGTHPPQEMVDGTSRQALQGEAMWLQLRVAMCRYRDDVQLSTSRRPEAPVPGAWPF